MKQEKLTANYHYERGVANVRAGKYKEAIAEYDKAIELSPDNPKLYLVRCACKSYLGKYKEALADSEKAMELDSKNPEAYLNRGVAKASLGKVADGLADFDRAIELNPEYALGYLNRAEAKLYLGDYQGAITNYDMVIKLQPKSSEAYAGRGVVKSRTGDYKGALEDIDKSTALKPDDTFQFPFWGRGEKSETQQKLNRPKHAKHLSYDENRDTNTKDYRNEMAEADYINALINLQLPTETYLRLRILQKFGYRYQDAANALDIPIKTLWSTTQRALQNLKKTLSPR